VSGALAALAALAALGVTTGASFGGAASVAAAGISADGIAADSLRVVAMGGRGGRLEVGCDRTVVGRSSAVNDGAGAIPASREAVRASKSSLTSNDHSPQTGGSRSGASEVATASGDRSAPDTTKSNTPSGNCSESEKWELGG